MVKANRPSSQKAGTNPTPENDKQASGPEIISPTVVTNPEPKRGKQSGRSRSSAVGGTAIKGAKSTVVKELSTGTPPDQQAEYYNRETRRRMQQMGTGPYSDRTANPSRDRRQKRQDRIKERQAEMKQRVDARGPSRDIKLGRRNAYFLIAIGTLLVVVIVLFIILRHPF